MARASSWLPMRPHWGVGEFWLQGWWNLPPHIWQEVSLKPSRASPQITQDSSSAGSAGCWVIVSTSRDALR